MWLPCNFGEKVIAREFSNGDYEEYYFIGVCKGCFNKIDYMFTKDIDTYRLDLQLEDKDNISYMPHDIHNDTFLKQDSLSPVEVDLVINIDQNITYKGFFSTKGNKCGALSAIVLKEDGYHYTFLEGNCLRTTFIVDKLIIRKPEENATCLTKDNAEYTRQEQGQLTLF